MKNRLIRAGMRPINNVVDITNYVMLELGQPLHAFDYDLLAGKEIIVRRAMDGETITSLDGVERELRTDMLVIADRDRAVAIAGVMGGSDSEVTPTTTSIMLESANFDAVSIRRTSKALALSTESSYRFERGVDPSIAALAAMRAAELMRDLADAEIVPSVVDVFPGKADPKMIAVRPERVNWLLGTKLDSDEMVSNLAALQIPAKLNDVIVVTVPTFRPDIEREVDVIEEIARIHGYEDMITTLPLSPLQGKDSAEGRFSLKLREILMSCGMQETVTQSLIDPQSVEITGMAEQSLSVRNPLSEDASKLRVMIAPNLLQVIARNQSVGLKDLSVFEIGKVYRKTQEGEIYEFRSGAAAMVGNQWANSWNLSKEALAADFYLAKGALESALGRLGIRNAVFTPVEHPLLHATRSAKVVIDGVEIGILGEVSPDVREKLDLRGRPCVFEIDVDRLMPLVPMAVGYEQAPRFPALHRHLAVVIGRSVPYTDIDRTIRESGGEIVEDVNLMDVYTGPQVGEDERSLTLSIVFRSRERTLTDEEVNGVLESVKARLASVYGARLRS
jgi:phenylalanyl-tRNA synthetase beta chain